jgi:hypothetical protein
MISLDNRLGLYLISSQILKVAILALFGASTILLVGAVHFSATGIIQSPDFLEPAYQGDEYLKELNPKSDHFRPRGNGYREVGYPEVINL